MERSVAMMVVEQAKKMASALFLYDNLTSNMITETGNCCH